MASKWTPVNDVVDVHCICGCKRAVVVGRDGDTLTMHEGRMEGTTLVLPDEYRLCRATTTDDAAMPVEVLRYLREICRYAQDGIEDLIKYGHVDPKVTQLESCKAARAWLDSQRKVATDAN